MPNFKFVDFFPLTLVLFDTRVRGTVLRKFEKQNSYSLFHSRFNIINISGTAIYEIRIRHFVIGVLILLLKYRHNDEVNDDEQFEPLARRPSSGEDRSRQHVLLRGRVLPSTGDVLLWLQNEGYLEEHK